MMPLLSFWQRSHNDDGIIMVKVKRSGGDDGEDVVSAVLPLPVKVTCASESARIAIERTWKWRAEGQARP